MRLSGRGTAALSLAIAFALSAVVTTAAPPSGRGPFVERLIKARGPRAAGTERAPDTQELRHLAKFLVLDAEAKPPTVRVHLRLGPDGARGVRGLNLALETERPGFATAIVPLPRLKALANLPGVQSISVAHRLELELNNSIPAIHADAARNNFGVDGDGVIVAIIDSGLDFAHGDFRDSGDNTRVVGLWDQTTNCGNPPAGFTYGCFYDQADVDDALDGIGVVNFTNSDGHGTHVTGSAAGDGSQTGLGQPAGQYVGVAPGASIVAVKVFEDGPSGSPGPFCSQCSVIDALTFVDDQGTALGLPVVANLSLGSQVGGHDGSDEQEIQIDTLTGPGIPGRAVVKSAGNAGGQGIHVSGTVSTGTIVGHTFTVPGYTPAPGIFNDVQAWTVWYDSPDVIEVTVRGPSGVTIPAQTGDGFVAFGTVDGVIIIDDTGSPNAGGSSFFFAELDDQCSVPPGCGGVVYPAPVSGVWTVTVEGINITAGGSYGMWIWFSNFGSFGAFSDWNAPDLTQLTSIPGTAVHATTVGAFVSKNAWTDIDGNAITFLPVPPAIGSLASFSSPGPSRDGRQKPEIATPGFSIGSPLAGDAKAGVLADPNTRLRVLQDGEHWQLEGTSFAAPHVAGVYALMLELNPSLDAVQLRTLLTGSAVADGFTGATPNNDWGFGKADVNAALGNLVKAIPDVTAVNDTDFTFGGIPQADTYNVFRVDLPTDGTDYGFCLDSGIAGTSFSDPAVPSVGSIFGYTVSGVQDGVEGLIGFMSSGNVRPKPSCP